MGLKPYIIAEIGSNWDTLKDCFEQIKFAKECGASAVKFQLYTHQEMYGYAGSMEGELPREWVFLIKAFCDSLQIDFMCSAFSLEGYKFINPLVKIHKIASCESEWRELTNLVHDFGKPFLISNGGKSQWQLTTNYGPNTIFMDCVAAYPAKIDDYRLVSCTSGEKRGLSDHTLGSDLAIIAVGAGYTYFEKHFNGAEILGKPDYSVSIGKNAFSEYCREINLAHKVMTQGFKYIEDERDIIDYSKRRWVGMYQGCYRTKK